MKQFYEAFNTAVNGGSVAEFKRWASDYNLTADLLTPPTNILGLNVDNANVDLGGAASLERQHLTGASAVRLAVAFELPSGCR